MNLDNKLANSQIFLTVALLVLIGFVVIWLEIRGVPHLDGDMLKEFTTWNGWLRNLGMIVLGSFWFNRNRSGGIPDQTVTHETTAPDGTRTVVKYPAGMTPSQVPPTSAPAQK